MFRLGGRPVTGRPLGRFGVGALVMLAGLLRDFVAVLDNRLEHIFGKMDRVGARWFPACSTALAVVRTVEHK